MNLNKNREETNVTHIKDISETIMIETTTDAVKVTLNAKQYQLDRFRTVSTILNTEKTLASLDRS